MILGNSPDSSESSGWVSYRALVNGRDSTDFTRGHFSGVFNPFWVLISQLPTGALRTSWFQHLEIISPCCTTWQSCTRWNFEFGRVGFEHFPCCVCRAWPILCPMCHTPSMIVHPLGDIICLGTHVGSIWGWSTLASVLSRELSI
jgi:hypothetical protein